MENKTSDTTLTTVKSDENLEQQEMFDKLVLMREQQTPKRIKFPSLEIALYIQMIKKHFKF